MVDRNAISHTLAGGLNLTRRFLSGGHPGTCNGVDGRSKRPPAFGVVAERLAVAVGYIPLGPLVRPPIALRRLLLFQLFHQLRVAVIWSVDHVYHPRIRSIAVGDLAHLVLEGRALSERFGLLAHKCREQLSGLLGGGPAAPARLFWIR